MNIEIKINNIDLELPDDTNITIVKNSGLFDNEYLYGDITYNITIVNTPHNAKLLENSNIISRLGREWKEFENVQLFIFGKLYSVGTLSLTEIEQDQFIGVLRDKNIDLLFLIKDKKFSDFAEETFLDSLNELTILLEDDGSLKKEYTYGNLYCLAPVYAPYFFKEQGKVYVKDNGWLDLDSVHNLAHYTDTPASYGTRGMLNFAQHDTEYIYNINIIGENCLNPIVPFVFAKHLLNIIGKYLTYTIVFDRSIPGAFNWLAFFSNYDISVQDFTEDEYGNKVMNFTLPNSFKVSEVFQNIELKEFIVSFMSVTNSFMKINTLTHTITFYTKKALLDSLSNWDVSNKINNIKLYKSKQAGSKIIYDFPSDDDILEGMIELNDDLSRFKGDYNYLTSPFPLTLDNLNNCWFEIMENWINICKLNNTDDKNIGPEKGIICPSRLIGKQFGTNHFELLIKAVTFPLLYGNYAENIGYNDWQPVPYTLQNGNAKYLKTFNNNEKLRAMFYYYDGGFSRMVLERDNMSLEIQNGKNGLYERLYKKWMYFLWKKTPFTANIEMSKKDFIDFDIFKKIKYKESLAVLENITININQQKGITGANITAHFLPSDYNNWASINTSEPMPNNVEFFYDLNTLKHDENNDVFPNKVIGKRPLSISAPQRARYNRYYSNNDCYKQFVGIGNFGTEDFSIAMFLRIDQIDSNIRIICDMSGFYTNGWRIEVSTTYGLTFVINNIRYASIPYTEFQTGIFYSLVITADRDGYITMNLKGYNLGVYGVTQTDDISGISNNDISGHSLIFGNSYNPIYGYRFIGGIHNVIIIHRILTEEEILVYRSNYSFPSDTIFLDKCDETFGAFNSINPYTPSYFGVPTSSDGFHATLTLEWIDDGESKVVTFIPKRSWQNDVGYTVAKEGMYYDNNHTRTIPVGVLIPRDESKTHKCCAFDEYGIQIDLSYRGECNEGLCFTAPDTYWLYETPKAINYCSIFFDENGEIRTQTKLQIIAYFGAQYDLDNDTFYIKNT